MRSAATRVGTALKGSADLRQRRFNGASEIEKLKQKMNGKFSIWRSNDIEEPTSSIMSAGQLAMKIRLLDSLFKTSKCEEERGKLSKIIEKEKEVAVTRHNLRASDSRFQTDGKLVRDKERYLYLMRYVMRAPGSVLNQVTYDRMLSDLEGIYGNKILDPDFLLKLMTRVGIVDESENLITHKGVYKTLRPPEFSNDIVPTDVPDDCESIREQIDYRMYAIDDKSTFEVDDAISYHDGWYAVHVADVSRYLPYNSELRAVAESTATTVYFPNEVITMLPKSIISQATLKAHPQPSHTLSIQFKLDPNTYDVIDTRLFVGLTNNCRRITYHQMDAILKEGGHPLYQKVKAPKGETTPPDWYGKQDLDVFMKLQKTAEALRQKRKRDGAFMLSKATWWPKVTRKGIDVADARQSALKALTADTGSYDIDVKLEDNTRFSSRTIVEEFMLLAGHSVAVTCLKSNIPCVFRVTSPMEQWRTPESLKEFSSQKGDRYMQAARRQAEVASISQTLKAAFYSSRDIGHIALRKTYSHFTSPLRRFPDLLIHYHVKMWLLKKSVDSKKKAISSGSTPDDETTSGIEETMKQTLPRVCAQVSQVSNHKRMLMRFMAETWLLRHIERIHINDPKHNHRCYVGKTHYVGGSIHHLHSDGTYCSLLVMVETGIATSVYHTGEYVEGMEVTCQVIQVNPNARTVELTVTEITSFDVACIEAELTKLAEERLSIPQTKQEIAIAKSEDKTEKLLLEAERKPDNEKRISSLAKQMKKLQLKRIKSVVSNLLKEEQKRKRIPEVSRPKVLEDCAAALRKTLSEKAFRSVAQKVAIQSASSPTQNNITNPEILSAQEDEPSRQLASA
eukprot:TRINITY_DN12520_c0_g1_i1.p1 TRINITY_DN12520_c0_g1~~TRINITY_DN12520_c0_g1_i1.p1  ORF type:complete len:850 (+),score=152.98 TRINITY_DN12520_c0_g1_i1:66-2615(+)